VTIGIPPAYPATGFGYIEAGELMDFRTATRFNRAKRFVEKPDAQRAAQYVASGNYCWNAGMFIWHVRTMQAAITAHVPELQVLTEIPAAARSCGDLQALLGVAYANLRKVSIDYAVMERADNIVMAYGAFGWDDVGTWPAVAGHFAADEKNNVVIGACETIDGAGNIVVSEDRLTALVGVHDLVVIQSENATLICPRDRAQEVKQMVQRIARRPDAGKYL
jgi:mannose-1-phosphate guanylyltransferase